MGHGNASEIKYKNKIKNKMKKISEHGDRKIKTE